MNNWPIYPQKDEQTEKMQATKKIVPLMFLFILTIGSYYISAQIGSFLTIPGTNIGYIWPPVGIALALMLLFGYRIWPAIAIAAVITDLPFLVSHFPLKTALFMAFGQTLADVLEIVLSVFLLTKISKDQQFFNRASAVLKFVLAVCISQFISAIINIASLYLGEKILYSNFGEILWSYWVSNVVSILLLTPLILIWVRNRKSSSKFRVAYHTIFYLLTIAATLLIFSLHIPGRNDYFEYFTFLFVICAAFVLGQTGVTMVVALVATITLWTTSTGSGPFIYATSDDSLLILEIYLATLSISGLVVSSVLLEQRQSESSLKQSEHLYRTLVETLPEGIAVTDTHGKITFVSDKLLAIYGSNNAQDAGNTSLFDWIAPESHEKAQANIQKLFKNDPLTDIQYTLLRKDGSTFFGEITGSTLKNEAGQLTGLVTIHRDITERKFSEAIIYRQITFDNMLTGMLTRFASSPQSDIDRCVRTGLQEIATFIGANQAYISMISADRKSWGITHEWHANDLIGINTTVSRIPFGTRPWAESRLLSREMVNIKTLADFPPDASEDRQQAEGEGVQSILSIPMSSMDENVTGSVTLRSHGFNKIWTEKDVDRFKMVVDTIASILERKQAQVALTQESELNASMAELSQQLLGSDSIQEIVDITLNKALALSGSKYGVIGYIDRQTGNLVYAPFTDGILDDFSRLELEAILRNLIILSSDVLENRQTLINNKVSEFAVGSSKTNMGQINITKILSVPGMDGNVLVGQIALANSEKDYNENDRLKIERLASIFALGIRHKQAEGEIRRLNLELEQRVLERTKELEAANKELESFSYSISHDLRAPIRAIDGLSRIAEEEFGASAPPEVARLFTTIRSNTLRMSQLIDDLLRFSRLTRLPIKKELVNHNHLVRDALQTLADHQSGRQVEIIIHSLPDCQGDPSLLLQVWINLLSNALKFTRKNNEAKIEIGFRMDEHFRPAYYVNDNGVGFDMQYAGKLFGVFQRLHNEKDFDGTGVGLALVSRIINRHGGEIWAKSAPNAGATFYFTLYSSF